MKKVIAKKHHSLADWDFDTHGDWHIDTARYHGAPSSLSCYATEAGGYRWVFLKPALVADLPDGRYVSWYWQYDTGTDNPFIFLRTQALPTNFFPDNCYWIVIYANSIEFNRRENGSNTGLASIVPPNPPQAQTWEHWRATFWQYIGADLQKVFRMVVDKYVDTAWVEQAAVDDPVNAFFDSGVNRIGFGQQRKVFASRANIDDTEVWRRVD